MDARINQIIGVFTALRGWAYLLIGGVAGLYILFEVLKAIQAGGDEHAKSAAIKQIRFIIMLAGGAAILIELATYVMNALK